MKKAALRKQFLAERRALSSNEVTVRSQQIADFFFDKFSQVLGLPPAQGGPSTIHTFLPILRNNEINTWQIVYKLWANFPSIQVLAPITDFSTGLMANYPITPQTLFIENKLGVPEPVVEATVSDNLTPQLPNQTLQPPHGLAISSLSPAQLDLVLVPLLIFNEQGQRVGYGGGFYDRLLAQCRPDCLKIGLSLFEPVTLIDDVFDGDILLDYCITSKQIWYFQDCMPT